MSKPRIATVSLAGCFGCHMSLMDIDERLVQLADQVKFVCSPLVDGDDGGPIDLCLVEGGLSNVENVRVLRKLRARSKLMVAVGACAINGGVPALRNRFSVEECLREEYGEHAPRSPELPVLLKRVLPIESEVLLDFSIPGCPPPADALWTVLQQVIAGEQPSLPQELVRYD